MTYSGDQHVNGGGAFQLGGARIEPPAHAIVVDGVRRRVRRKLMQALTYLAARRDQVVTRAELLDHLWPDRAASDESLTQIVSELRRVLGEAAHVETVPGRGYRLVVAKGASIAAAPAPRAEDLAASDRRWGFALLVAVLATAQLFALFFGGGGHHWMH